MSQRQRKSLSEQLEPIKGLTVCEVSSDSAQTSVLPFPKLLPVEQIIVPEDDTPNQASSSKETLALKSNTDYWAEFESNINEFAVAKTVVDYLDKDPEMKIQLNGLYVKACITIKREQIKYAQEQEVVESTALAQSAAAQKDLANAAVIARQKSPFHWIKSGIAAAWASDANAPGMIAAGLALIFVLGKIG